MELEGTEPTIHTAPHLSRHPNRIHEKEPFLFNERKNWVRRYDTPLRWGSTRSRGSSTSGTERVRPKVGKQRVCIVIVWSDEMEMRWCLSTPWSAEDTPRHSIYLREPCISIHPPSLLKDLLGVCDRVSLEMHLEAGIESIWRYTRSPWSSGLRDELRDHHRASLKIHLEAVIKLVWRCTCRPWWSEFGGRDRVSLEAVILRV